MKTRLSRDVYNPNNYSRETPDFYTRLFRSSYNNYITPDVTNRSHVTSHAGVRGLSVIYIAKLSFIREPIEAREARK